MKLLWADNAWEDYLHWQSTDGKTLQRVNDLIKECQRTPFEGTGKPEPLKGDLQGWWSRRITQQDRLVYRVKGKCGDQHLEIAQCRQHYRYRDKGADLGLPVRFENSDRDRFRLNQPDV